jgi:hypothetical protein
MLNLDANKILGDETQGISKLMRECGGLVDLLDIPGMGPEGQLQDTYRQGTSHRINFMLGTARVHSSIRHSGALEYNDGIVSDHRGLYVDLDPMILFGGNTDDPVAVSSHGFTSKNKKKTKAYLDNLDKYFIDHKICEQINNLIEDAPRMTQATLKRRYKGLNTDITRGMLAAESKVHPYRTYEYDWSPELDEAGYCLQYW